MRKLSKISWALLGIVSVGAGCSSSHVAVDAKSDGLATYQSAVGHVNTPAYQVGDIVEVDPATHKVWKAAEVQISPLDLAYSQPGLASKEQFGASLDFTYDGKCQESSKQQVNADVQDGTVLHVEGYWTRSLKHPAIFIASSDQLLKRVSKLHAQHPGDQFFLVSAVSAADKIYLADDATKDDTVNVDKHQFHVHYAQNAELAKMAKEKESFFKLTALKLDSADGQAVVLMDRDGADSLPQAQFGPAVASTW
ncbi:MAG TPA: hypothetical protein VGI81_19060 [Tepidisphaeraceae bacterium]|jgi:hypothetical protein